MFPLRSIPTSILTASLVLGCGRVDRAQPRQHKVAKTSVQNHRNLRRASVSHPKPLVDRRVEVASPSHANKSAPRPLPNLRRSLGDFKLTYYWVADEPKKAWGKEPIYDKTCKRIARVTPNFKKRLTMEGSGKLKDGRMITTAGGCKCGAPCFWEADADYQWGAGVSSRPLNPFRSVAVDPKEIRIGTSIYVAELDGLTMPGSESEGGFVHDGCVVADDRGGGVRGKQIDFFAARRSHYQNFFRRHRLTKVRLYPGGERCQGQAKEHALLARRSSGRT